MQSNIFSRNLIEPMGAFLSLEFNNFYLQKTHLLNTIILSLTQKIIYSFENFIKIINETIIQNSNEGHYFTFDELESIQLKTHFKLERFYF